MGNFASSTPPSPSAPSRSSTRRTSRSERASSWSGRPLGLRQVDAPYHHSGPGGKTSGAIPIRGRSDDRGAAQGSRHRDGVPILCALPGYDRRRKHRLRVEMAECPSANAKKGSKGGSPPADRTPARPQARPALRRPAPTRSDGPGAGAQPARCSSSTSRYRTSTPSSGSRCGPRSRSCMRETPTTIVYVTHDQIEAMTMATRIAVMKDGIIHQFGTPAEIYDRPSNTFVATFMGSPPMNLFPGEDRGRERTSGGEGNARRRRRGDLAVRRRTRLRAPCRARHRARPASGSDHRPRRRRPSQQGGPRHRGAGRGDRARRLGHLRRDPSRRQGGHRPVPRRRRRPAGPHASPSQSTWRRRSPSIPRQRCGFS